MSEWVGMDISGIYVDGKWIRRERGREGERKKVESCDNRSWFFHVHS